jgi:glycosyltransferase involved in cell wall biosynthesis
MTSGPGGGPGTFLHALPTFASGRNSLFLWLGLGPLIRTLRSDLIYCWEEPWCLAGWQVRLLARRLGVPLIFYTAENRPKRLPWPFTRLMRAMFREARACVAPTSEIADNVIAAGYAGPVLAIPLWIRGRRRVRADTDAKVLVYVGRLIPLKRVGLLVEALPLLQAYRLRILGDGPERERLRTLADSLGAADRVEFLGHFDNSRLEDRLDGASLLVLPTGENPRQAEQFGKAALEAVACGLPVLASRGGNLEKLAALIPTIAARDLDTPRQMAEAVLSLMAAYPTRDALESARATVEGRFGPAAVAGALEASFSSLAAPLAPPIPEPEALA